MTLYTPQYRMRVYAPRHEQPGATETDWLTPRTGSLHTDAFHVTTLPVDPAQSAYKPYLLPPRGRRSSLNLRDFRSDVGSMEVEVLDKRLGLLNEERWVSQFASLDSGEARWLNCLVELDETLDDCTFDRFFTGRIKQAAKTRRNTWTFAIHDLAEDLKREIFSGRPHPSVTYASVTALMPPHNIAAYHNIPAKPLLSGTKQTSAPFGVIDFSRSGGSADPLRVVTRDLQERASAVVADTVFHYPPIQLPGGQEMRRVAAYVINPSTLAAGRFYLQQIDCTNRQGHAVAYRFYLEEMEPTAYEYATWASLGANGATLEVYLYALDDLKGQSAIQIDSVHVVELLRDAVDGKFGPLTLAGAPLFPFRRDTSVGSIWDTMIADPTWGTFSGFPTRQEEFDEWAREQISKPYGLAYTLDAYGNVHPIDVRPRSTSLALPTIVDADVDVQPGQIEDWSQDVEHAITAVDFTVFSDTPLPATAPASATDRYPDIPPAAMETRLQTIRPAGSVEQLLDLGFRPLKIDAQGMRSTPGALWPHWKTEESKVQADALARALDLLAMFARGERTISIPCRRTAVPQATTVGVQRILDISTLLNPNTQLYGDELLVRCVERTEDGPVVRLGFQLDGVSAQADVPTIGTPTLSTPRIDGEYVQVDITLNAAGEMAELWLALTDQSVVVRPADSDPEWFFATVTGGGTSIYGPLASGKRVWFRARTNPRHNGSGLRQPSGWVYPSPTEYVDTGTLGVVTGLTVTNIAGTTADLTWSGGTDGEEVEVLVHAGGSAVWPDSEVVGRFVHPPRYFRLSGLTVSTLYSVAVRRIDPQGVPGPVASTTFNTTATPGQLANVAGLVLDYNSSIRIRVWPGDASAEIELERADDSGGAPDLGTVVVINIGFWQVYDDVLPADYREYHYRARHIPGNTGMTAGNWTIWVKGTARPTLPPPTGPGTDPPPPPFGQLPGGNPIVLPQPVAPSFDVVQSSSAGVGTAILTVTDPQLRVTLVEFQTFDGTTTSAWTPDAAAPYMTTVPYTHQTISAIRWRVTGYDENSQLVTLGQGEVYFGGSDAANLEMLVGGKAPASHLHLMTDVIGLAAALAGGGGGADSDQNILANQIFGA